MELFSLIASAVVGAIFGWYVSAQLLAFITLIGLTVGILAIGIGAGNPTRANVYFVYGGFCTLLFIFGAWVAHTVF